MRLADIAVVAGIAVATALGIFGAWTLMPGATADDKTEVKQPTMEVGGAKLTVNLVTRENGTRDVVLHAVAGPEEDVELDCGVAMMYRARSSPMSRMVLMPTMEWQENLQFMVPRGESKDIVVKTGVDLSKKGNFTLYVQHDQQSMAAATVVGTAADALAATSALTDTQADRQWHQALARQSESRED